ncbi:DDE-domain-containing protein [Trametes versicolor FP-101664 SS1]|uniref:DDE-domain-containing protein n=1 Tax=Trametes versicolor (strain FP-101664) TaxID=717944 RepID=UPI000462265C|nr:DDE-domain-containing protein [Trametes versicolor FP-101664 SS1]EIW56512.1 DDE-domain-containing protein [Trametes versicolor FP-101664 SS1]
MDLWLVAALSSNILLSGEVLRQKWKSFADRAKVPLDQQLRLSNGWLEQFKKRHGLREFKRHGEAASADLQDAPFRLPPDRGLSDKATAGVKGKKVHLTYAFTANADGTDKLPPFVIGKWKKPRPFAGKTGAQLGFRYRNNAKAWMTTVLYQEWIQEWDRKLTAEGRNILLLQDNFSAHVPPLGLRSIQVENFKANLTAHVQPNDQGIIRCFKAHYRARFIERAINRYNRGITPSNIYNIDQLEAMRLADAAWMEVDANTLRHCWRKAGILPPDLAADSLPLPAPSVPIASLLNAEATTASQDPVRQAEKAVEEALDGLVMTGALQTANRMDVDFLLNPPVETEVLSQTSEEEIFLAVQESREDEDEEAAEGDDEPETPPTRHKVLEAAALLTQFTNGMDTPAARKLEDALTRFTREMWRDAQRSMKDTSITDYLSRT